MNDKTKQKPLNDHMDMLIKVIKGEPLVLIQRYKKMNFKNIQEFIFLSQSGSGFVRWGMKAGVASRVGRLHTLGPSGH